MSGAAGNPALHGEEDVNARGEVNPAGSAIRSSAVIRPPVTAKLSTESSSSPGASINPAVPFTSTGLARR